jgi:Ca-activated chloride channel homolog
MYVTISFTRAIPLFLFFCLVVFLAKKAEKKEARLPFSLMLFFSEKKSLRGLLALSIRPLFLISLLFLLLSLSGITYYPKSTSPARYMVPRKGIGIFLLVDRSSSMGGSLDSKETKLELVQALSKNFIQKRENDLIGLLSFSRKAELLSPLSLDRDFIEDGLQKIVTAQNEDEDGTALGYAIFKATNLIVSTKYFEKKLPEKKGAYSIENQIIVVLTDGLESPNPKDTLHPFRFMSAAQALKFAQQNQIRVYMILIAPKKEKEAYIMATKNIQEACENTKGGFFFAEDRDSIARMYEKIDSLEKSPFPQVLLERKKVDLSFSCAAISFFFSCLAVLFQTLFCRRVP